MVSLSSISGILGSLYQDKLDIHRFSPSTDDDGTTKVQKNSTPVATNVACRASYTTDESSAALTEANNPRRQILIIFCGPAVDIRKGDSLTVRRLNDSGATMTTYTGLAGAPKRYPSHQEIEIVNVGVA